MDGWWIGWMNKLMRVWNGIERDWSGNGMVVVKYKEMSKLREMWKGMRKGNNRMIELKGNGSEMDGVMGIDRMKREMGK